MTMAVEPKDTKPDALTEGVLLGVEEALNQFIESLKEDYDKSEDRMIFVSVHSQAFLQGS